MGEVINVEQELRAIVKKKTANDFGLNTKITEIGIDSLDVVEIIFNIEDEFKIEMPQNAEEMATFTFGDLCRAVEQRIAAKAGAAPAAKAN